MHNAQRLPSRLLSLEHDTSMSSVETHSSGSASFFSCTSPDESRLEDSLIESLFAELDSAQSGHVSRRAIEASLLKVYQRLAPAPKPYHLIHPSRPHDWAVYVESLFAADGDSTYTLDQFKWLVHSWDLPSFFAPLRQATPLTPPRQPRRTLQSRLSHLFQQVRARCTTNGHRYIFVLVVLSLQISLALWQFFLFFNNAPARAAFVSDFL